MTHDPFEPDVGTLFFVLGMFFMCVGVGVCALVVYAWLRAHCGCG